MGQREALGNIVLLYVPFVLMFFLMAPIALAITAPTITWLVLALPIIGVLLIAASRVAARYKGVRIWFGTKGMSRPLRITYWAGYVLAATGFGLIAFMTIRMLSSK